MKANYCSPDHKFRIKEGNIVTNTTASMYVLDYKAVQFCANFCAKINIIKSICQWDYGQNVI